MGKRKTTEQFIAEAVAVHGDKYDYSKVEYKGNNKKVTIYCKEHGDFEQVPSSHLSGSDCWLCGVDKRANNRRGTQEEFINNSMKVHGDKYDYSKVEYVNSKTKVTITCPEHGDWRISPNNLLTGYGCPSCGLDTSIKNRRENILKDKFDGLVQPESYKLIPLTKGKFAIVDNEDFERLKDIPWNLTNKDYAENSSLGLMHRYIMNAPDDMLIDHENGNGLDNRKSNLRLATPAQNMWNKRPINEFKGVSQRSDTKKYRATINKDGVTYNLGCFDTPEEASEVYNKKALELFGDFAWKGFQQNDGMYKL